MTDEAARLREILALHEDLDDLIEKALIARHALGTFMTTLLPFVCGRLGASGLRLETYGEDLELEVFSFPEDLAVPHLSELEARTGPDSSGPQHLTHGTRTVVAQRLDVAGEWFGRAIAVFERQDVDVHGVAELLDTACEELDNYLFAIRAARQKQQVMLKLADALRHRVLAEGLGNAVQVLAEAIPLERMLLVFVADEGQPHATLHVQLFEGGRLALDTMRREEQPEIVQMGRDYLTGTSNRILERLGRGAQEEVLINGVTHSVLVGKVIATSKSGSFNTYDRDLLASFAGFVRQRIVDFNKEWRSLAAAFRDEDVARLVQTDDYQRRFLSPREETVAILYTDIAGFTKLSEQVLRTPSAVAELVEAWSERAVRLLWQHGGVFDKMVGDCIIGLFGPPFYDEPPTKRLQRALDAAIAIRDMTQALPKEKAFEHLRGSGLAVSTGVNLAPLFVGTFGPNANFTGFSSGMNNTARLQGCAKAGEILVMSETLAELPAGLYEFGDEGSAAVKNVAQPLRYRAVLRRATSGR